MNKVILEKQKQKEKEKSEEKDKKKNEKSKTFTITKLLIRNRLLNHFSHHIGEENKTNKEEIFQKAIGVNSYMVNSFVRFYWFKIVEQEIRKLRKENKCFIIKKQGDYFVLKEQNEADYYKQVCNKAIVGMENAQERANEWVKNEKWREIEDYAEVNDEDIVEEEKTPKPKEEIIDDKLNSAKTKVIKLWKGEQNESLDK